MQNNKLGAKRRKGFGEYGPHAPQGLSLSDWGLKGLTSRGSLIIFNESEIHLTSSPCCPIHLHHAQFQRELQHPPTQPARGGRQPSGRCVRREQSRTARWIG